MMCYCEMTVFSKTVKKYLWNKRILFQFFAHNFTIGKSDLINIKKKRKQIKKLHWDGGMAQEVEHLTSKCEAPSSNPSTAPHKFLLCMARVWQHRLGVSCLKSKLLRRWKYRGSRFTTRLDKNLSRPHLNKKAGYGGTHLSSQLCVKLK
jgi:hypothetical protein